MAVIYATLIVNTNTLKSDPTDVAAACLLYDSNLDPTGAEDFTISTETGDKIIFNISARDNETPVCFFEFGQENGTDAFDPFPTYPRWKGTVAVSGNYFIKFMVPSIQDCSFKLDPEISVNP